jgi:cobalt/nickel transport system permease protein
MHMADALISPVVGGTLLAATVGVATYSIKKLQTTLDDQKIPLMGVMGAFVFAAQMINFTIPGTGSSGHLGGGLLLAALLGPYAGFLSMASILLIQALFFGDGGLLAWGCNVFNLGFFTCFIAYPLIFQKIARKGLTPKRIIAGSMTAAVVGLQLGAFSAALETLFSGKTELTFTTFILLMQPIHLAIGVVEGLVTSAVITFVWKARPEIIDSVATGKPLGRVSIKNVQTFFLIAVVVLGGALSWFASSHPDGLEWALQKSLATMASPASGGIQQFLANLQSRTAFLPDYGFKFSAEDQAISGDSLLSSAQAGTSVSGLVGGILTLALVVITGLMIRFFKKKRRTPNTKN